MAELVEVRMLTRGPNKNLPKGEVIIVDADRAAALIKKRHAKEVDKEDGNGAGLQER
jgi:uncharacterized protein YrrD